jgi:ADP-ribose pyrophosphatase
MPPARRLQHRTVFNGRVFHVERDRVRLPHGREVTMDIVRHRGSVVLIPRPDRSSVILIRQYRYAIGRWIWELPAGSLEAGEAPARAARRECEEEIGLTPRVLRRLGAFYPTPGFCDEKMIFYACDDLVPPARPAAKDEDEQIVPRRVSLKAAWALVASGGIVDMKTIVGLDLVSASPRSTFSSGVFPRAGKRPPRVRA